MADTRPNWTNGATSRRAALMIAGAVAAGSAAAAMASTVPGSPLGAPVALADTTTASNFSLAIDGIPVRGVQSIDQLEIPSAIDELPNGRSRPGRQKPGTIKITRDFSSTKEFYNWRKAVIDGKVDRKSVSIILSDAGDKLGQILLGGCWAENWTLNARNSAHATETLEVVFETIEMK
ncbi:MAG: phage tail protein [Dehalococcoidia bacterium]